MATGGEVLNFLCAGREWTIYGDDYENILWHEGEPYITKKQFLDGFAAVENWKIKQAEDLVARKEAAEAKLAALGLTSEDLKALGIG